MFEHVPELLRRLRLNAHWSQQELAARSGVSVSQLSRIENGQQTLQLDTLGRLLEALNLTLADFTRHYEAFERRLTGGAPEEAADDVESIRRTARAVVRTFEPLLEALPPDATGTQIELPRHWIYILPKPRLDAGGAAGE